MTAADTCVSSSSYFNQMWDYIGEFCDLIFFTCPKDFPTLCDLKIIRWISIILFCDYIKI